MRKIVIGDVQGCLDDLKKLLDLLDFKSSSDQLIFLGDLVNRGPKSLEVLEFLYSMSHCVLNTLGNHDFHLLALVIGNRPYRQKDHSIKPILDSKNKINLIEWLRHQPIMHEEPSFNSIMVHAGIHPSWDIFQARSLAREIESIIQSNNASKVLSEMYSDDSWSDDLEGTKSHRNTFLIKVLSEMYSDDSWSDDLEGTKKINSIINCFTRLRFLDQNGVCNFKEKNSPDNTDDAFMPWFMSPEMKIRDTNILFGHWSTLGDFQYKNISCLDAGCVWGGEMIAIDLKESQKRIKIQSSISR